MMLRDGVGVCAIRCAAADCRSVVGVKPVVVALIAQAVWSLGKTVLKSRELAVIAAIVLALAAVKVSTLPLLIGTGVAWIAANRFGAKPAAGSVAARTPSTIGTGSGRSGNVRAATTTECSSIF